MRFELEVVMTTKRGQFVYLRFSQKHDCGLETDLNYIQPQTLKNYEELWNWFLIIRTKNTFESDCIHINKTLRLCIQFA